MRSSGPLTRTRAEEAPRSVGVVLSETALLMTLSCNPQRPSGLSSFQVPDRPAFDESTANCEMTKRPLSSWAALSFRSLQLIHRKPGGLVLEKKKGRSAAGDCRITS